MTHPTRPHARSAGLRLAAVVCAAVLTASGCDDDPEGGGSTVLPSEVGDELQLAAQLDGRYVSQIRIEEGGSWRATRAHQQITLTLAGSGLSSVRQFEFVVEATPVSAFDLASAVFTPAAPLRTLGAGIEAESSSRLRAGAATLTEDVVGDRVLGTLTLKTSSSFNALTGAQISVVFVSVGPSVSDRDNFEESELRLGVVVN